jgi:transposase
MTIVSEVFTHVIGVDTHAKTHTFAIVKIEGDALVDTAVFPTTKAGLSRGLGWVSRRTPDSRLLVVEGIGTYGARLAQTAQHTGWQVVEAGVIPKNVKRGRGKTDALDAARIARSVIGTALNKLRQPRFDLGVRDGLRVLTASRNAQTKERTAYINELTALVRNTDLGVDARNKLSMKTIRKIASGRPREEPLHLHIARTETKRLAKRILKLNTSLKDNKNSMIQLIKASRYHTLLTWRGIGPVTAAQIIVSWGTPGRVGSEASFAGLAGVQPVPSSSGNHERYRLNRGGDRQLNKALYTIINYRMTHDPETIAYVTKRRAQAMTDRSIRRILKRYLARRIWRLLNTLTTADTPNTI